jgi:uncharacterized membrane protein
VNQDPRAAARSRHESAVLWIALAALLLSTSLLLGLWIRSTRPENLDWLWAQIAGIASFPGKFVIFSGLIKNCPMGPLGLSILCVAVDSTLALVLALFLGPLGRLPRIGPWLLAAHLRAGEVLRDYPRLQRMAFAGIVFFVFLPLPGTGAVGGIFAGQLVGLSRPMGVLAVTLGTALIAVLFCAIALTLGAQGEQLLQSPWYAAASALAFALFLLLAYRAVKRKLRQP